MDRIADKLVSVLLEDDGHSEHMKGWDRIKKWDGAVKSYADLRALQQQAEIKYREMGQALSIERALAYLGIQRTDVDEWITGAQIGATHNYKRTVPFTTCRRTMCELNGKPVKQHDQEGCPNCGEQLVTTQRQVSPIDIRTKFGRYIVGVRTNDGRTLWFQDPVPPKDHAGPRPGEIQPS
jgi:hypothetical protein